VIVTGDMSLIDDGMQDGARAHICRAALQQIRISAKLSLCSFEEDPARGTS